MQLRQVMSGYQDGIEWITQIVPNYCQQQISGSFNLLREKGDRFQQGLINGLVESSRILHERDKIDRRMSRCCTPEPQHTGAQRAVFRRQLHDTEAHLCPQQCMSLSRSVAAVMRQRSAPGCLLVLLMQALRGIQIENDCAENVGGMIAQCQRAHVRRRRQMGSREPLPFSENGFHIAPNEIGQSHALDFRVDDMCGPPGTRGAVAASEISMSAFMIRAVTGPD